MKRECWIRRAVVKISTNLGGAVAKPIHHDVLIAVVLQVRYKYAVKVALIRDLVTCECSRTIIFVPRKIRFRGHWVVFIARKNKVEIAVLIEITRADGCDRRIPNGPDRRDFELPGSGVFKEHNFSIFEASDKDRIRQAITGKFADLKMG
ncbi:MAG: hypothetical protein RLN60_00710 [Phycisphaerales bacterium]